MTLVSTDESIDTLKMYEELWSKIRYFIRLITSNSDNQNKIYMKTTFNTDNELPLKKKLGLYDIKIVVRSVFHEVSKYYHKFS